MPVQQSRPPSPSVVHPPRVKPLPPPPNRRLTWLWWLIATLVVGVCVLAWIRHRNQQATDSPTSGGGRGGRGGPIPVVVAKVRTMDFPTYVDALGTVTALNNVTIRSRVDGELMTVAFTEGQMVHQGDLLVQIDPRPFQVQLDQATAQLAKDQAALKNAQVELERYRQAKEAIPQQQIDTQQATVDQDAAAIKIDQSAIENAQLQLTYARITAPITGRIGLRLVDPGNIVHASDTTGVATIAQIQPISVIFAISRDTLEPVLEQPGRGVGLTVEAYDREFLTRFDTGKVTAVDNQADVTTGTIRLRAEFQNEKGLLFPQQFVNARLLVQTIKDALVVPLAAIQRGPDQMYVFVVKDDQVEIRNIKLGPTEGDQTVITEGLADGEAVVTDGLDKLQDKTKVQVREPGKNRGGATSRPSSEPATSKPAGEHGTHRSGGHGGGNHAE